VYHTDDHGWIVERTVCDDCVHSSYSQCSECGDWHDEVTDTRHGPLCSDCYSDACQPSGRATPFIPDRDNTFDRIRSRRCFGVELETSKCSGWRGVAGEHQFKQHSDGSILGEEFVSPILAGDKGLEAIEQFCKVANSKNWKVNRTCGFHVHFDVGDFEAEELRRVAYAYLLTYDVWAAFVSDTRRENTYCRELDWHFDHLEPLETLKDWEEFSESLSRYQWLNIAAYTKYRTFEIRLHSGTLKSTKVCNWVIAHARFIDAVSKMTVKQLEGMFWNESTQRKFERIVEIWDCPALTDYFVERAAKFGVQLETPALCLEA
jgi:hypothetical protein